MSKTHLKRPRESARIGMIEEMGCKTLAWEIPGPPNTRVDLIQCWGLPEGRLIIVEIYEDGGCDVFPQILARGWTGTADVVKGMAKLEKNAR